MSESMFYYIIALPIVTLFVGMALGGAEARRSMQKERKELEQEIRELKERRRRF